MLLEVELHPAMHAVATVGALKAAVAARAGRGLPLQVRLAGGGGGGGGGPLLLDDAALLPHAGVPLRAALEVVFDDGDGEHGGAAAAPAPSEQQQQQQQQRTSRPRLGHASALQPLEPQPPPSPPQRRPAQKAPLCAPAGHATPSALATR